MFINTIIMVMLGLFTLLPVWQVFCKAFSGAGAITTGQVYFWPVDFQWDTLMYVIKDPQFQSSIIVTLISTVVGTLMALFLIICAAYPLSKPNLVGRRYVNYLFIFLMLFGAGMIPTYLVYRSLNLTNTIWALIVSGSFSVFQVFVMKNYFESLPDSIEEAAEIDGAGPLRKLNVVLPMSKPVLATIGLFQLVGHWNNYMAGVLYITDPTLKPLPQLLYDLLRQSESALESVDISQAMAMSTEGVRAATIFVSVLPIIVCYPILQKYFVKGMTIGSVKG
ncbi:MAG: carbohydrate ABC transporter permease [Lachnospiraceae bacterium]